MMFKGTKQWGVGRGGNGVRERVALVGCALLAACGGSGGFEPTTRALVGAVQKGPFIIGTHVSASELYRPEGIPALWQYGRRFTTTIDNNAGTFAFDSTWAAETPIMVLSADGYYYNELAGKISESRLVLDALVDTRLSDVAGPRSSFNVNLLSHLERPRVAALWRQGLTFAEAKTQAKREVFAVFDLEPTETRTSDELDIGKNGDEDAKLLAMTVILQAGRTTGEMSELASAIAFDLADNGLLDSVKLRQALMANVSSVVSSVNLPAVRANLTSRYADLGVPAQIGDFEKHVKHFYRTINPRPPGEVSYPVPMEKDWLNLLAPDITEARPARGFGVIRANVPPGLRLDAVFTILEGQATLYVNSAATSLPFVCSAIGQTSSPFCPSSFLVVNSARAVVRVDYFEKYAFLGEETSTMIGSKVMVLEVPEG